MKALLAAWLGGAAFGIAGVLACVYWCVKTDEKPIRTTAQRAWWQ